jgi:HD-GYP domain-containing protein (c-di-GMP phosphodiesterase class II)
MSNEKKLSDVLAYIVAALSNCALYSPEHPAVEEFSRKTLSLVEDLFVDDSFSLTLLADSLIFNEIPVSDTGDHISRFTKKLKAKGIERVIIKKGVSLGEMKAFVSALASRERTVSSSPHIAVGMLEVRYKAEEDLSAMMGKSIVKVNEVYDGVSRFRRLDIRGIEDVVMGFIAALKKEANVLSHLGPVKSHSAYTYVHETNVAVLTIFQAEALGMKGEVLHDIGLAGLLHDVGKLFIPKEIIEKQESLNEKEWSTIKLHPVYGAVYLSTVPDVAKSAVIAAYEHHLKYDGSGGYPQTKTRTRRQHLISQFVAIADVFDALRTKRAYRPSFEMPAIIGILMKGSGKDFNPVLVDNFIAACKGIKAI